MQFRLLSLVLSSLALAGYVASNPVTPTLESICDGGLTTLDETYIGQDKNVKLEHISCKSAEHVARSLFDKRQELVCGAACTTNCFLPAGGGPNPNDCHVIADALRFDAQNTGALFQIGTGTNNTLSLSFRTCRSFFLNQDIAPLTYCRLDFADVIDFVAPNCQATQNAHGGNCVANDQRWFVQVQSA